MNKIIAVASGKGGTGKSTVSAGIGRELANGGSKVLLIDCDSGMRGLDIMLGVSRNLVFDMADAISGECEIENCVYSCGCDGNLFMIPAPHNVDDELSPDVFKRFIEAVEEVFDYIIIDSPAGIGMGFRTAVSCADLALIVCNAEPISLRGCEHVRQCLIDCGVSDIKLVINKFNGHNFVGMGFYPDLDFVIDYAKTQLIAIIPEDLRMVAAVQSGRSAEKGSPASAAFERLTRRIKGERVPLQL
ncbi:MAG: AAA family ATPase [Clostridia bacterium]|nr:AAA family ATPase [Clostridia bacterium]